VRNIDNGKLCTHQTREGERPGLPNIPLTQRLLEEISFGQPDLPKPQAFGDPAVSVQLRVAIVSRAERVVDVLIDNDLGDMI
jgi:hypothetical protein